MSYLRYGCACLQCAVKGSYAHDEAPLGDSTSTWAQSPTTTVAYAYTGDYRVDTLLEGLDYRWNAGSGLGAPVTVSYSFMSGKPWYGGTDMNGNTGFTPFTLQQQAAVRTIMSHLQQELNISFVEVFDSSFSYGQIRFGNNAQSSSSGYSWLPNSGGEVSGDVWIDTLTPGNQSPVEGNDAWATLVHEIGHALGLKHPGNYNAGTSSSTQPGNYLGSAEDNTSYTIMSYFDGVGGQPREWYGMYDLLALKTLYGADQYNAGDTVHAFNDADGRVMGIIDDAWGTDTLDVSALTRGTTVDLRPGSFSSVGRAANGTTALANLSIDTSTWIENFRGSAYADNVTGNAANNRFSLGTGSNVADGLGGIDTGAYTGGRASYSLVGHGGAAEVVVTGTNIFDVLHNVERIEFADQRVAFDIDGSAGMTAKILGATFGSAAVSNAQYVGMGLSRFDTGSSAYDVMYLALASRLDAHASAPDLVNLLYRNVVGQAPDADAMAYYTGMLQSGTTDAVGLGLLAANHALNAQHIDLVGLASTGLVFA